jgi:two-component system, LytTR family, sensor kinase
MPAVLLHISLEDTRPVLVGCGYLLSAIAVGMHFWEIRGHGAELHQAALLLITIGFLVLTGIAVALAALGREAPWRSGGARIAGSMCLALFAMSFVHFGSGHAGEAWSAELVIHHAGIPLALFVLLQDYRFVLLDAFVRFLTNALLAALLTVLVIEAAFRLVVTERVTPDPLQLAILLASVCLFLVFFAWLRSCLQGWLTRAVFRHGELAGLVAVLRNCPAFPHEEEYLDWATSRIAATVKTDKHAMVHQSEAATPDWVEAAIPLRLGPGDWRLMLLGRREGGQRYLGEDLDALAQAAAEIAERVDSLRQQEMTSLVSQAELRALQSQINPHFLFNALNTVYSAIPREAVAARRMVINLADIFRYFLQSDNTLVPLEKEMEIVRAYLELEQSRLGNRLRVDIQVDDSALQIPIPVLSIQPLVENAIKHGVAPRTEPGYVHIQVSHAKAKLLVIVEDSGSGANANSSGTGVGLQNVRRRLQICYGSTASLQLDAQPHNTSVALCIPLAQTEGQKDRAFRS